MGIPCSWTTACPTSACSARTRTRRACRIRPAPRRARCALEFGTLAELRERHPEGVSALGELTDETGPAVVFAPHRDAAKGGVLRNPQEVSHEA